MQPTVAAIRLKTLWASKAPQYSADQNVPAVEPVLYLYLLSEYRVLTADRHGDRFIDILIKIVGRQTLQ